MNNRISRKGLLFIVLVFFVVALLLRLHRIGDVQVQFDEWLGGWHANPVLNWEGSFSGFIQDWWNNTYDYLASGQTIAWSALIELYQFFGADGVVAVRFLAALGGALSVALLVLISWKMFSRDLLSMLAVGAMAAFSVVGILFGQFADVYAAALISSSAQLACYFLIVHSSPDSRRRWLLFFLVAAVAQLLMYTQVWLTGGILLAAGTEGLRQRRFHRRVSAALYGLIVYFSVCVLHFHVMLKVVPWSESFRWYMGDYYPLFLREPGILQWLKLFPYFLVRLYDFFSYHWAAVFAPDIYQPLKWNPVFFPFLLLVIIACGCRLAAVFKAFPRNNRKQNGQDSSTLRGSGGEPVDRISEINRNSAALVQTSVLSLVVALAANFFSLMPFGGIRQTLFLHPPAILLYGWCIYEISRTIKAWPRLLVWTIGALVLLLSILPFLFSIPSIYQDRISRLDLNALGVALDETGAAGLVVSEQNIQILEVALVGDPRFEMVHWEGYEHPSDALDADFISEFPVLSFEYGGKTRRAYWATRDYFPPVPGPLIWVDMHISLGSRFEGEGMRKFYPDPAQTTGKGYVIKPILEQPGNSPSSIHQSLYWPPNSYYLYLIRHNIPNQGKQ